MSKAIIETLQETRQKLQDLEFCPDIEPYREEISGECNVAVGLLTELQEAEARKVELEDMLRAVKDLPNKMQYSNVVKETAVVENKIKELSAEINHSIRNHEAFVANKKRAKIEIERLEDILRVAQTELAEYDDAPSLRDETMGSYVPLHVAREQALTAMKATTKALEEVREALQKEKEEHRDLVYDLKKNIKTTKAEIEAIENGTYAPAVEFEAKLSERRTAQTSGLDAKRGAIEDEIGTWFMLARHNLHLNSHMSIAAHLQSDVSKDTLVHDANVAAFEAEKTELELKLAEQAKSNATSMQETESTLEKLKEEQTENAAALQKLEERLAEEQEEARLLQEQDAKRLQEWEAKRALEEKEHFAALWIQLRWKAYLKRKALKGSKGKKGKKGKKK